MVLKEQSGFLKCHTTNSMVMYGSRKRYYTPNGGYQKPYFKKARYSKSTTAAVASRAKFSTKGPSNAGTLTQQVKSLQRIVRQLQPELKAFDLTLGASNISVANGAVDHITQIAQGDGQNQRTGNLITVRKLDIGIKIDRSTAYTFTAGNAKFRWAVVVDKEQVTDTSPVALSAFEYPSAPHTDLPQVLNNERFRYLYVSPCYDLAQMAITSLTAIPQIPAHVKFHWEGEVKVGYNGSLGSDIEKNGIYVVYMTEGTANELDTTGYVRVQYTDV